MKHIDEKNDLSARIDLGVRRGVARALAQHKKEGRSIYVWKNGKVVEIPAEKIKFDKKCLDEKSLHQFGYDE